MTEIQHAAWRGTPVIVVDPDPSPIARRLAEVVLPAPAEEVLPELVAVVRGG